jgi:hypothetical protein
MPVVINEVVTEVVLGAEPAGDTTPAVAVAAKPDAAWTDLVVRRAAERVLEVLRREWER